MRRSREWKPVHKSGRSAPKEMHAVAHANQRNKLLKLLRDHPVIPSLQREDQFPFLLESNARAALLSSGSIFNIEAYVRELHRNNKVALVHIDLIDGLGRDAAAVRFLKEKAGVDGIVTPNRHLISEGRKEQLITVHRLFAHDSPSIDTGVKVLQMSNPDFIEVLPGMMAPRVIPILRKHFSHPIIGAGLIKTPEEVMTVLDAGAVAVDTSAEVLWNLKF